jgi:hypothetical protein
MGRIVQTNLTSNLPTPVAYAVLAVAPLVVGVALLAVHHVTLSDSRAARDWVATPCVIEKCELSAESDIDAIVLEYRYSFDGRKYLGERPDLMPGTSGSDAKWQRELCRQYRVGSRAVCYVDPANPANSVFDRDHGRENARGLLLLAYPFLCIGAGFSLGVLRWFAGDQTTTKGESSEEVALAPTKTKRRHKKSDKRASRESRSTMPPSMLAKPGPPPRKLGWLNSAVVLAGPRNLQIAWLFVVGFSYIFVALNGPASFAALLDSRRDLAQTIGQITYVHPLGQEELDEIVYEYGFAYDVNGSPYMGKSYTRGREYSEGNSVSVQYDPAEPSYAVIVGARRHNLTWWYGALPLGVLVLLAIGLAGMYWHSFRTLQVLRQGESAKATLRPPAVIGAERPPDFATVVAATSRYEFFAAGYTYPARHYCHDSGKEEASEVVVVYDPGSPKRNVIFDEHLSGLIGCGPGTSVFGRVLDCVNAPLAIAAIILLFFI